ncbi:hypothetical protein [Streptacidiphilus sp. PAMC 29251]
MLGAVRVGGLGDVVGPLGDRRRASGELGLGAAVQGGAAAGFQALVHDLADRRVTQRQVGSRLRGADQVQAGERVHGGHGVRPLQAGHGGQQVRAELVAEHRCGLDHGQQGGVETGQLTEDRGAGVEHRLVLGGQHLEVLGVALGRAVHRVQIRVVADELAGLGQGERAEVPHLQQPGGGGAGEQGRERG